MNRTAPWGWVLGVALVGGLGGNGVALDPGSSTVYHDVIDPLVQARCVRCHGAEKVKGNLRLDTPEGFLAGGSGGSSLSPGDAENSELYIRITLPQDDEDHMPSQGEPLSLGQIEVIRWWIDAGASFEHSLAEAHAPPTILEIIAALDFSTPAPVPPATAAPAFRSEEELAHWQSALAALQERDAVAVPLFSGSPLVAVNFAVAGRDITDQDLVFLAPLASKIVSLNLAGTHVSDEGLHHLAELSDLVQLNLGRTSITDQGLAQLASMDSLKILNLVNTSITDDGLTHLKHLANLQALYLWQTQVTEQGVVDYQNSHPGTEVVRGWEE